MTDTPGLPRYQCHKQVWALKISAILHDEFGAAVISADGGTGFSVRVDTAYVEKHKPAAGGYWVKYDDGYQSYSPAAAFEAGYTRI
jgi:hypothetical protein